MKVSLRAYINDGVGAPIEVEIEKGRTRGHLRLKVISEYEYDNLEIDGLSLWRAILALMASPEASGLKKDDFEF
jgi:hypothetical protein